MQKYHFLWKNTKFTIQNQRKTTKKSIKLKTQTITNQSQKYHITNAQLHLLR